MSSFNIVKYSEEYENKWDKFIFNRSINGTFLQSRQFLNYHPSDRFKDASLLIQKGTSLIAVIPACEVHEDGRKIFISHKGSTFGGIVLDRENYNIKTLEEIMPLLDGYLATEGFDSAVIHQTSDIFSERSMDLIDYYYFKNGWDSYSEVSFYVDLERAPDDIISGFSSSRRRDYKYSLKNDLYFKKMDSDEEIIQFHSLLSSNLEKFNARPVHTTAELLDFKNKRLQDIVDFYGVYTGEGKMVAASMLFYFANDVLHTQYLAQSQDFSDKKLYAMEFLDCNLIQLAKEKGFKKFSFGISTEEHGKVLNIGLASFKEGFGCDFCVNKTYLKKYS